MRPALCTSDLSILAIEEVIKVDRECNTSQYYIVTTEIICFGGGTTVGGRWAKRGFEGIHDGAKIKQQEKKEMNVNISGQNGGLWL